MLHNIQLLVFHAIEHNKKLIDVTIGVEIVYPSGTTQFILVLMGFVLLNL